MASKFSWAIKKVLIHEGGYVNIPADPGGETNFGICKRAYPDLDIKNLTQEDAIEIYKRDYWQPWMDKIDDPILSLQVFDFGVNAGVVTAARILQKAARVDIDGIVGPITLSTVNTVDPLQLRKTFAEEAIIYYKGVSVRQNNNFLFFRGWIRRALDNLTQRKR